MYAICKELKISRGTGYQYVSDGELYTDKKVPKFFIDKAIKKITDRAKNHEKAKVDILENLKNIV